MKIAIVGTGISGLVAAHLLRRRCDITVFEADERVGGHTNTVDVDLGGERHRVDTGFIVYNERTYPNFSRLLDALGVATQATEMSFSVTCERSGLEYATHSVAGLFARPRNAFDPGFYRMLADVVRFNREARDVVGPAADPTMALDEFLARGRYSRRFIEHYVVPMGAAIWSAAPDRFLAFPAASFVRFFHNHGLLDHRAPLQWRVVRGGSMSYVEKLIAPFRDHIHRRCPVLAIRRQADGVEVLVPDGVRLRFDHVVLACHSDQALALLDDADAHERRVLGAIRYQANEIILHTDAAAMPKRRAAWASWNYRIPRQSDRPVVLTYDMNRLQSIESSQPLLVSLNCATSLDPERILRRIQYHHPVYDAAAVAAQTRRGDIDGTARTHFCGAYWGNGFHEDGVVSALAVAERFGERL